MNLRSLSIAVSSYEAATSAIVKAPFASATVLDSPMITTTSTRGVPMYEVMRPLTSLSTSGQPPPPPAPAPPSSDGAPPASTSLPPPPPAPPTGTGTVTDCPPSPPGELATPAAPAAVALLPAVG